MAYRRAWRRELESEPRYAILILLLALLMAGLLNGVFASLNLFEISSVMTILSSSLIVGFFFNSRLSHSASFGEEWEEFMLSSVLLVFLVSAARPLLLVSVVLLLFVAHSLLRSPSKWGIHPLILCLGLVSIGIHSGVDLRFASESWAQSVFCMMTLLALGVLRVQSLRRWESLGAFVVVSALMFGGREFVFGSARYFPVGALGWGGTILLTLFVLSDPRLVPNDRWARCIWGASVALGTYMLSFSVLSDYAFVFSILVMGPLANFLDQHLPSRSFRWPRYQMRLIRNPLRNPSSSERSFST